MFGRVVVLCDFLGLVDFADDLVACFVAGGPAGAHGPAFDLALAGVAFDYFDPVVFFGFGGGVKGDDDVDISAGTEERVDG